MIEVYAYLTKDGNLFKSRELAKEHETTLALAKELAEVQTRYEAPDSESALVSPLANGEIHWGVLLDWLGANRDDVQTILNYLENKV